MPLPLSETFTDVSEISILILFAYLKSVLTASSKALSMISEIIFRSAGTYEI